MENVIQITVPSQYKDLIVNTIFELAREHRYYCDGSCGIALFPLRDIISQILGRPLTHDEFKQLI